MELRRRTVSFMNCGMRDPLMTRQKMMNRFREEMSFTHPSPVRKHRAGATAGAAAVAAVAAVAAADENSSSADGSDGTQGGKRDASSDADSAPCAKRTKRGTLFKSSNTRAHVGGAANGRRRCPACIRGHDLKDGLYIHKNRAPRWWRPDESMAVIIEKRRKHDAAFEELPRASG
ncbi:hypothetical protein E4U59_000317 [Claviceps monticola]|nr:hypothetical protein E4U59_000317 [Claviceps monticola]